MKTFFDKNILKYNIFKSFLDKKELYVVLNNKEINVDRIDVGDYVQILFYINGIDKVFTEYLTKIRIK
jgi:predicted RNA-binding protein (virulence factor B family)